MHHLTVTLTLLLLSSFVPTIIMQRNISFLLQFVERVLQGSELTINGDGSLLSASVGELQVRTSCRARTGVTTLSFVPVSV